MSADNDSPEVEPSTAATKPEPSPNPTDGESIHDMVIADMHARKQFGLEKYQTILQAHNGRDTLVDAYQEALDLTVYLRQVIAERDGWSSTPPTSGHVWWFRRWSKELRLLVWDNEIKRWYWMTHGTVPVGRISDHRYDHEYLMWFGDDDGDLFISATIPEAPADGGQ